MRKKYSKGGVIKEKAETELEGLGNKKQRLEHQLESVKANIKKYQHKFVFINKENFFIKFCFKNKVSRINKNCFNKYLLNPFDKYNWPFIDLFIYTEKTIQQNGLNIDYLKFFMKDWNKSSFYPPLKVNFEGIENVCIPAIPDYFLKINYGNNYMTTYISNSYNHREEKKISSIKIINIK